MKDNVVVFPRANRDIPPQSIEEIHEKRKAVKKEHIEVVLDDVMSNIFYQMHEEGFDLADEDCIKTTAMLIETMRAAMYKAVDFNHPLHDLANSMFKYESEEDPPEEVPTEQP
jgi:hypothetical protein